MPLWVGNCDEAAHRLGCGAAVQRDAERAHAHPQDRDHRHSIRPAAALPSTRSGRSSPVGWTSSSLRLSADRRAVQVPPPDVAGELRDRLRIPHPAVAGGRSGGRRELDEAIGEIASTPLDRAHPLWEMYFVEGLANDRIAVVVKIHHALADGVASANLMARRYGPDADPQGGGDSSPIRAPRSGS